MAASSEERMNEERKPSFWRAWQDGDLVTFADPDTGELLPGIWKIWNAEDDGNTLDYFMTSLDKPFSAPCKVPSEFVRPLPEDRRALAVKRGWLP